MPDDQPDARDLRERVADLEATVSDQQETIQKLMPSRRQAMVGAGLLGGGLLGGRLSTGTARAQAAGQVGTDTEPVDVKAWDLNIANRVTSDLPMDGNDVTGVGAMDVEQASIGGQPSDEHWEFLDSITTTSNNSPSVDLSEYDYDEYRAEWSVNEHGTGPVTMTIDGDDAVADNGNYGWWDNDGVSHSGQDYVRLFESTEAGFTVGHGTMLMSRKTARGWKVEGFGARPEFSVDRISAFVVGAAGPHPSDSIEISTNDVNEIEVEVYGRNLQ